MVNCVNEWSGRLHTLLLGHRLSTKHGIRCEFRNIFLDPQNARQNPPKTREVVRFDIRRAERHERQQQSHKLDLLHGCVIDTIQTSGLLLDSEIFSHSSQHFCSIAMCRVEFQT